MDIHLLSDTELNEAIAVKKGWKHYSHLNENGINETWITPNNKHSIYGRIPDFTHDRGLAMELFLDLVGYSLVNQGNGYYCSKITWQSYTVPNDNGFSETLSRAICEAWLEWKGK